jgi:hypothetical protein
MEYRATATVVDGKWRVTVPDIAGYAETDTLLRIEFAARMMIAEQLKLDPDSFDVRVKYDNPPREWVDPDGLEYRMVARKGEGNAVPWKLYVPKIPAW